MEKNTPGIPVVMYHTVGRIMPDWKWSFLTVPARIFEDHLLWLVRAGYRTVNLDELHSHVSGEQLLPARSVVLTFDDGYLDNWTYVAPLLRRYGCKGTVFVNPDFVDPMDTVRPTLEEVWAGKIKEEELEVRGFMSWPELQRLAGNGPLRIEAHAMTHTWYPTGPEIVDFHHPDDGYYWLDWNAFPEKKSYYLLDPQKTEVPFGAPVYEHQKSLAATRYFPDPGEEMALIDFMREQGGEVFSPRNDWRAKLLAKVREIRQRSVTPGRYETEAEQLARYRLELVVSKKILQERLGRKIEFLCWPGGGYNELTLSLALEHYTSVTLGSADPSPARNRPGEDPRFIKRLGVPGISTKGRITYPGGRYFLQVLKEYQGNLIARRYRQTLKALALGREAIGDRF